MITPPFCPYAGCSHHVEPPRATWWQRYGFHCTRAFGKVQRFRCLQCGRTFSAQTFSVHFYAKRVIKLQNLDRLAASSMSTRALSREFACSCGSIVNRIDRISRQGIGLHASLRITATTAEPVCFDGLVSFDRSQYYPSDVGISITAGTRFILGVSHATTRRSGCMRPAQKSRRDELYASARFEKMATERSFTEHLNLLDRERTITRTDPLILITDEKREYERALHKHRLYLNQSEDRRCVQLQVSSKAPRVYTNPLFASNYIDREIRKDQANHRRETTCFSRRAANTMSRLYAYIVQHNYFKRYVIKWPVHRNQTAAVMAGIDERSVKRLRSRMYTRRTFLSHLHLEPIDLKIWEKAVYSVATGCLERSPLPRYAFG